MGPHDGGVGLGPGQSEDWHYGILLDPDFERKLSVKRPAVFLESRTPRATGTSGVLGTKPIQSL
jgi:hypothetical protein